MNRGAWTATVHGVAKSRIQLSLYTHHALFSNISTVFVYKIHSFRIVSSKQTVYLQIYQHIQGEGNGTPLQYSCLENPMDGGAWQAAVHGVTKSRARLSDFTFTFHFQELGKEMATHSSVPAWRIPGTEDHSGLPPMGSHRVGHD